MTDADSFGSYLPQIKKHVNNGIIRTLIYFAVWILLYFKIVKPSMIQDKTGNLELTHHMWKWSCVGLFLFAVTLHLASVDWLMSLDSHWFSTIFGVYYFAGSAVCGLSTIIILTIILKKFGYLRKRISYLKSLIAPKRL